MLTGRPSSAVGTLKSDSVDGCALLLRLLAVIAKNRLITRIMMYTQVYGS